jgi:ketosteroid isomerase-like protein
MSGPASPEQVVRALMDGISTGKWSQLHELYADDAVIEYPFAVPAPRQIMGRGAIRDYFKTVASAPLRLETRNMVVRATADPEVVVAEWDYDGRITTTGHKFRVSNIQVTRVRAGKIVVSHDYHNHWAMAAAMGRLDQLVEASKQSAAEGREAPDLKAL